jgi:hypothetical protein
MKASKIYPKLTKHTQSSKNIYEVQKIYPKFQKYTKSHKNIPEVPQIYSNTHT